MVTKSKSSKAPSLTLNTKILNQTFETTKERLVQLFKDKAVYEEDIILSSGQISTYYVDAKQTILSGEGGILSSLGIMYFLKDEVEAIGGYISNCYSLATGVTQLAYLREKPINSFFVRSQPRTHGHSRWVDGPIQHGNRICIITDVVTNAVRMTNIIRLLQEEFSVQVMQVIGVLDRLEGGRERIEELGIEYNCICTIDDILGKKDAYGFRDPSKANLQKKTIQ